MRRRFTNLDLRVIADPTASNQILYTTTDKQKISDDGLTAAFLTVGILFMQNTYDSETDLGIILLDNPLTVLPNSVFKNKYNLKTISIPDTVTGIETDAFNYCFNLTDIRLSNKLNNIKFRAFQNCGALETISLPDTLTSIGDDAFSDSGLITAIIPNSVTTLGSAFKDCSNLKSVIIGDSVSSLGGYMFQNCENLVEVTFGKSITSIDATSFSECDSLNTLKFNCENIESWFLVYSGTNSAPMDKLRYNVKEIILNEEVVNIKDNVFANFGNLEKITIGSGVTTIGYGAFSYCKKLNEIKFHAKSTLKTIRNSAFYNCGTNTDKKSTIILPITVSTIELYAFHSFKNLLSITLSPNVKTILSNTFTDCVSLESIKLLNGINDIQEKAFENCKALEYISLPASLKSIEARVFKDCPIAKINLENVLAYLNIAYDVLVDPDTGEKDYSCCPAYKGAVFYLNNSPLKAIQVNGTSQIPPHAFHWKEGEPCAITITGTWADGATIGPHAFENCNDLYINTTNSVSEIQDYAFYNCKNFSGWIGYKSDRLLHPNKDLTWLIVVALLSTIIFAGASSILGAGGLYLLYELCVGIATASGIFTFTGIISVLTELNLFDGGDGDGELHTNTTISVEYIGKYAFSKSSIKCSSYIPANYGVQVRCPHIEYRAFYDCDTDAIKYTKFEGERYNDYYIGPEAFYINSNIRDYWIFYFAFNNFPDEFDVYRTINLNNLKLLVCPKINDFPIKELEEDYNIGIIKTNFRYS